MEESVALDSTKQKQFVKSVRGIKKLLKKKSKKVKELGPTKELKQKEEPKPIKLTKSVAKSEEKNEVKKDVKKSKNIKKSETRKRGLVYLSHIPHGFYEHQMTEYFKQFGVVTNARVIRSKHTGNSKGYAFVEFKEPAVAEIVADTMNNYLMGKRLIKAVYIPPEKQRYAMRKKWSFKNNPGSEQRLKIRKALNAEKNDKQELLIAKNLLSNLSSTKEKLRKLGIDYDFLVPVDVPEALNELVQKSMVDVKNITTNTVELKKKIKVEDNKSEVIESKSGDVKNNVVVLKKENNKNKKQTQDKNDIKSNQKQQLKENINKNKNLVQGKDKIKKLQKQDKSTEVSKKVPENFIKINKSDSDSVEFDSDAFEEIINNDDDDLSSDDQSDVDDLPSDDQTDDDNLSSSDTHGFNEVVQKSNSFKEKIKPTVATKEKSKSKTIVNSKQGKGVVKNVPEKRKNASSVPVTPKKLKFEKQNKKTLNKVVKTRK